MALNNFYPAYQPSYYGPNPYTVPQQIQPMPQAQAPQQRGFIRVQNEQEARTYPVAPGNSVTFIDENAPYCYTKTMDFSQLDRPKFEKYRLVKEEDEHAPEAPQESVVAFASQAEVDALRATVDELMAKVTRLTARRTAKVAEGSSDE